MGDTVTVFEEYTPGIATNVIKEHGGYMTFDQFDAALENIFLPHYTLAGWGSYAAFNQNQKVFCAMVDVNAGLITKEENGYRVTTPDQEEMKDEI